MSDISTLISNNIITISPFENNENLIDPYCSLSLLTKISPCFITGLVDAEGSFTVSVVRCQTCKFLYRIMMRFTICLHIREADLLKQIMNYFRVGNLVTKGNLVHYNVNGVEDLSVIINHFINYPLLTFKHNMFIIFSIIYNLMANQTNLTIEGFRLIVAYINLLNNPINTARLAEIKNQIGEFPVINLPPVIIND